MKKLRYILPSILLALLALQPGRAIAASHAGFSPVTAGASVPAVAFLPEETIFHLEWQNMPLDSAVPRYTEVIPLESDYRVNDYQVRILYPEWQAMSREEIRKMEQWADCVTDELDICTHVGVMRGQGLLDVDFVPVVRRDGKYLKLLSAKMEIVPLPKSPTAFRTRASRTSSDSVSVASVRYAGTSSDSVSVAPTRYAGTSSDSVSVAPVRYARTSSDYLSVAPVRYARTTREPLSIAAIRYASTSRLASGKWVKIGITEDGMYRLTADALRKMGFSNPANVHLYGQGGHRLSEISAPDSEYDDLEEVPLYQVDSNTWLFWGNGLVYWDGNDRIFNPYATTACYFLTEEDAPGTLDTLDGTGAASGTLNTLDAPGTLDTLDGTGAASGTPVTSFTDHVLYEKDEYAWAQIGRNLVEDNNFASGSARTYKLTLPGTSLGNERLTVSFSAAADAATTLTTEVNGNELASASLTALSSYQAATSITKTFDVSKYASGADWSVRLTSTQGHDARLDYLALHYTRVIDPGQTYVAFSGNASGQTTYEVSLSSGSPDLCSVIQLGEPGSPATLVKTTHGDGKITFTVPDGQRRFVCFNTNYAYPQPTVIGTVQNQNLHALDSLDMVIIIPESAKLESEANRLALAHAQYDGLRVAVVRADQVYNEFSSGTPDATAYRRLMKMLYDRADGNEDIMPRYLLLMGDCAFDNRMLTSRWKRYSPKDYLLCFESENSYSDTQSYCMEDYFGLLDDGEGAMLTRDKVDIGVGRFPVTTADEARIMVDKVIDYISNQNAGSWKNVVMMLGDDGDNNSHMKYCDDVAKTIQTHNPELEVRKVMWDAYTRVSTLSTNTYPEVNSTIHKQLDEGVMVVNYTGHGRADLMSHEAVWHIEDFTSFKSKKLPLWFTAACDIMPFDGQTQNLGEEAVLTAGGGALAFVGTARTVYASNNYRLNNFFSQYLFDTDDQGRRLRLGDALRLTKSALAGSEGSYLENKLQYALLGDPALTIGAPLNRVKLNSLTDNTTGKKTESLKAGMPVTLEGQVVDADGRQLPAFRGVVTVRIYDSMDTITCRRNDPSVDEAFVFTDRSSVLYVGQDSVRDGRFQISFVVPKDIKYSGAEGRMVFYAIDNELTTEANGYYEDFTVGGTVDATDTQGPSIELTLNGEVGGTVNASPYLVARLADESGVNVTGNGVGHDILLSVDNNPQYTYVLNDYYVSDFGDYRHGSLAYTIPALPEGPHTLTLRAWDMLNNTSIEAMDFNVDLRYEPTILSIGVSPNPAITSTTFFFSKDLPGSDCEYLIEVFDFAGRLLWRHEGEGTSSTGQFSVPWDLSVGSGNGRIGPGIYLYRVTLSSGQSERVSKSKKLIVN